MVKTESARPKREAAGELLDAFAQLALGFKGIMLSKEADDLADKLRVVDKKIKNYNSIVTK
jgi:hypothetical protein